MEYKNYRVRSPVKSFRDLEVYQKTIQLYAEIISLEFLNKEPFQHHKQQLQESAETIPKLIAESYGDKFDSKELANNKLTEAITLTTNVITKIDILKEQLKDNQEEREILTKLLSNYQRQKIKTLNLRKAWNRLAKYDKTKNFNKR